MPALRCRKCLFRIVIESTTGGAVCPASPANDIADRARFKFLRSSDCRRFRCAPFIGDRSAAGGIGYVEREGRIPVGCWRSRVDADIVPGSIYDILIFADGSARRGRRRITTTITGFAECGAAVDPFGDIIAAIVADRIGKSGMTRSIASKKAFEYKAAIALIASNTHAVREVGFSTKPAIGEHPNAGGG